MNVSMLYVDFTYLEPELISIVNS